MCIGVEIAQCQGPFHRCHDISSDVQGDDNLAERACHHWSLKDDPGIGHYVPNRVPPSSSGKKRCEYGLKKHCTELAIMWFRISYSHVQPARSDKTANQEAEASYPLDELKKYADVMGLQICVLSNQMNVTVEEANSDWQRHPKVTQAAKSVREKVLALFRAAGKEAHAPPLPTEDGLMHARSYFHRIA